MMKAGEPPSQLRAVSAAAADLSTAMDDVAGAYVLFSCSDCVCVCVCVGAGKARRGRGKPKNQKLGEEMKY